MEAKYKYKFVRINFKQSLTKRIAESDYQMEIISHAQQGWRFMQIFAPMLSHGYCKYYELIFEKEI